MPKDLIVNGELVLYGTVGCSWWDDEGFCAIDVLQALAGLQGDIVVRLNSGGGIAWDGIAIYNALNAHEGKITVKVDGIAASSASIIAMAGDEIIMGAGALMMIHNASGITFGTADDHQRTIDVLRRLDGQMAAIYARKCGMDQPDVAALMSAETWLTGTEAVEKGFASSTDDGADATASSFDYRIYAKAPEHLRAAAKDIPMPTLAGDRRPSTAPAAAAAQQEVTMTDTTTAAAETTAAGTQPAPAATYTAKMAAEVMELCAIAGVSIQDATAMVKAETPIEKVRADLAARAAAAADSTQIDASRNPPKTGSGWDEVTAKVNETYGVSRK